MSDEGGAVADGSMTCTDKPVAVIGVRKGDSFNRCPREPGHSATPPAKTAIEWASYQRGETSETEVDGMGEGDEKAIASHEESRDSSSPTGLIRASHY